MEQLKYYDEWKTEQPEPTPIAECSCCGDDLYSGDFVFYIDGQILCNECIKDYGSFL